MIATRFVAPYDQNASSFTARKARVVLACCAASISEELTMGLIRWILGVVYTTIGLVVVLAFLSYIFTFLVTPFYTLGHPTLRYRDCWNFVFQRTYVRLFVTYGLMLLTLVNAVGAGLICLLAYVCSVKSEDSICTIGLLSFALLELRLVLAYQEGKRSARD